MLYMYVRKITILVFFVHFKIFNFLKEQDTDIFVENKNVPCGRFSPNIVKTLYRMRACVHAHAQLFKGARLLKGLV